MHAFQLRQKSFLVVFTVCVWVFSYPVNAATITPQLIPAITPKSVPDRADVPRTLKIPTLGISATIEARGTDRRGILKNPRQNKNVAWFRDGVRPGEKGNAVIWGHLNSRFGAEVFYRLDQLQINQVLEVVDAAGKIRRFRVVDRRFYKLGKAPLNKILGPSTKARLNLFTCAGTYSRIKRNYSHRLVIFTEAIP